VLEDDPEVDATEVRRSVVEICMNNSFDWDEVREDLFNLSDPVYFHGPEEGCRNTLFQVLLCS
jgi:hypothetical protein